MNEYLDQLKRYIIDNSNGTKLNVHLKIYSSGNGNFKVSKSIKNELNEDQFLKLPTEILIAIVNNLLSESRNWNILEIDLLENDEFSWKTYWDSQREAKEKAPIFDENASAEFVDEDIYANSDIEMDYASTDSLRPWYFVKRLNTSIETIVETMLEHGAELDPDDLDELNFHKESWKEIFTRLQNIDCDQVEVKIKIDAEFDSETKAIEEIIFYISQNGDIEEIRISDF